MSDQEVVAVSSSDEGDWPEPVPMKPVEEALICVFFKFTVCWPELKFLTESLNTTTKRTNLQQVGVHLQQTVRSAFSVKSLRNRRNEGQAGHRSWLHTRNHIKYSERCWFLSNRIRTDCQRNCQRMIILLTEQNKQLPVRAVGSWRHDSRV